jgi:hypothetical protein
MRQDDDGSKQTNKVYTLDAKQSNDYVWDNPTAPNRRIQLSCDGVPFPRNIDMMAIGVQPPLKVSVRSLFEPLSSTDRAGWTSDR